MQLEDVVKQMIVTGQFTQEHLDSITQEMLDDYETNAKNISEHPEKDFNNYSGNDFVVSGQYWYWKSSPGSMCGRDTQWTYGPVLSGSSFGYGGKCPQGYEYKNIYCVL